MQNHAVTFFCLIGGGVFDVAFMIATGDVFDDDDIFDGSDFDVAFVRSSLVG